MTTLDPAHLPSRHEHRGTAVTRLPGSIGKHRKPVIPDLRFEQSYLTSIQSFISYSDASASPKPEPSSTPENAPSHSKTEASEKLGLVDSGNSGENEVVDSLYGAPLDIRWRGVLWVTARDQMISPLLQGALWGTLGMFITPLTARLGQNIRSMLGLKSSSPSSRAGRTLRRGDASGDDVGWFRRWVRSFYTGVETNVALRR